MTSSQIPRKFTSIIKGEHPLSSLQNELDRAITSFNRFFEPFNFSKYDFENISLLPAVDIVDDNNEFKIEVEMPGMGEEDVKVSINNGLLTIKGEKSTSEKDEKKNYMRREIKYGFCERNVPLPEGIDIDKAKATFKKGMLWVTIPKKPEYVKGSREIQVEKAKE